MNVQPRELSKHYKDVKRRLMTPPPKPLPYPWSMQFNAGPVRATYGNTIPYITMGRIIAAVCQHYGVSRTELCSSGRMNYLVGPRHVMSYLCRTLTDASYPHIGQMLGGRDHTTIMHGVQTVSKNYGKHEPAIDAIKRALGV
jgi:chromosomal replication initiation ATPase DnaA